MQSWVVSRLPDLPLCESNDKIHVNILNCEASGKACGKWWYLTTNQHVLITALETAAHGQKRIPLSTDGARHPVKGATESAQRVSGRLLQREASQGQRAAAAAWPALLGPENMEDSVRGPQKAGVQASVRRGPLESGR